jgi:transposase-like protein
MGTTVATELVHHGERRDRAGRHHRPRERREQLLAAYRESGLTRAAFAKREGICYATFCHWAQRAAKSALTPPSATSPVRFAEVALPSRASTSGLEVSLPDGTLVRGGSIEELAALVRALRRA